MQLITDKKTGISCVSLLLALLICVGCQSRVVQEAASIKRDNSLTCLPETPNRCAIPSELQDLADPACRTEPERDTHYVGLLDIGEDALLARIHLIRAARESIDLQTFIWDDDAVGQMLFMELLRAARRGVKVRIILDQFGTYVSPETMARMATAHENLDIQFFRPVMKKGCKSPTREIGSLITNPKCLIKRMHNKLFVVDRRIGIVGGRNIQNTYYDYDSRFCFKDLDILVVGPEAGSMVRSFNTYWEHDLTRPALELTDIASAALKHDAGGDSILFDSPNLSGLAALQDIADCYSITAGRPAMKLHSVKQIKYVADRPDKWNPFDREHRWNSTRHVEELVLNAQHEIVMQTPYLIQDRKGIRDFKKLRKERPDLRIALSTNSLASTDKFYVYAMCFKQRQFYLERVQAQLYEFKSVPGDFETMIPRYRPLVSSSDNTATYDSPGSALPVDAKKPRLIIHAKFFVVDESVSFVGSHNFDPRANNLNTENAVIVWDKEFAASLKQIFDRDTAPQNSWVVARRQKVPVVGNLSDLIAAISSSLPLFDIWPFEYGTSFELKDGFEPLASDHPNFYEHYQDVWIFPQMSLTYQDIGTRFVKAFGGLFRDMM
ncbi:MAG: phospholipase D family protein [Planctomycetota bacterium]